MRLRIVSRYYAEIYAVEIDEGRGNYRAITCFMRNSPHRCITFIALDIFDHETRAESQRATASGIILGGNLFEVLQKFGIESALCFDAQNIIGWIEYLNVAF